MTSRISLAQRSAASLAVCLTVLASGGMLRAQEDTTAPVYRMPAPELVALVDQPITPAVSISPDQEQMLFMHIPGLMTIEDLAQPELRIAGMRINPRTNGPSRARYYVRLVLRPVAGGSQVPITGLPDKPKLGGVRWSPDASHFAFTNTVDDGIELWVAETASGAARRLTGPRLNAARGTPYYWLPDGKSLAVRLVPAGRGAFPGRSEVPAGPVIQENLGRVAPARTYQDLLKNPDDEALFEHHLLAQVALVDVESGSVREIGPAGLINRAQPSPDGQFLLVQAVHRPFSYLVPASRFPSRTDVWDLDGSTVATIAEQPLADNVPTGFGAVPTGKRSISWRADADATLYWVEAQDGGDPRADAEERDRVYTLAAPFDAEPEPLASLGLRYAGVMWGDDGLALVTEIWFSSREMRTWIVRPGVPEAEPRLLFERSMEDSYNNPGSPVMMDTPAGTSVLLTADGGNTLYLVGEGASPEGNRPFLDRLNVTTGQTERLWRSEAPYYERPVDLLGGGVDRMFTRRESVTEPPDYFIRDLTNGQLTQLTEFEHPTPQLADVKKELIRYKRSDGVDLTATLYLPADHKESDGPLPVLMWAYPTEYKSADLAGQLTDSPYRFVRVSYWGALPMLTQGWAVLDDPSLPIIGEGDEEPNDTFVDQLVAGAQAAVDEMVRRGVGDPDRMAIGGHSYGAFMTGNLLAHSDLFRTGIARSGAYNRSLTPFGFQREERTFWEAPEIYFAMSPFMHADDVDEPILMIHGEADNNSGTFPLQSRRFYNALKGHGATARLVMLPLESHGYSARESILHMLWEEQQWLKRWVEDAPRRMPAATTTDEAP